MRSTFAAAAALAAVAHALPGAVTSAIAPSTTASSSCVSTYDGSFEIEVVNATSSKKAKRDTALVLTLTDGVLHDEAGRTGYIASNDQFQFDDPPQAGAIYTAGWTVCSNGTLALGDEAIFWECLSGTFYNLYDDDEAAQCSPIYIEIIPVDSSSSTTTAAATATAAVCEYEDGQPQVTDCVSTTSSSTSTTSAATAVCEYEDGQPQVTDCVSSTTAAATITSAVSTTSAAVVSQISDGQIQASTGANTTVSIASATATASSTHYTGAAMPTAALSGFVGMAAGVVGLAML